MNKKDFLDTLYQRHSGNVKLGLDRMYKILEKMNHPHKQLQGIHIAGTNGKGSTAAMCEAIGLSYSLRTGLNTSPHLVNYNERIRIQGQSISFEELMDCYHQWQAIFEQYETSFFEITTAMAFYLFVQKNIDFAIFEVGLGGRLDGTNPFQSTVTTITSISYDHPKSLGDSVEKIAAEKAGIIKENTPLVLGKMNFSPYSVIEQIAKQKHAPIMSFDRDYRVSNIRLSELGTIFDYESDKLEMKQVSTNLLGMHQAYNAAAAITSFCQFAKRIRLPIDPLLIRAGLKQVNWAGRMQIVHRNPTVILDGAHNEEGIEVLTKNLQQIFPDKKLIIVLAILRDKKIQKIMEYLSKIAHFIIVSKNQSARAAEIEEQTKVLQKFTDRYSVEENVLQATHYAMKLADEQSIIVVSGSLYTISELLQEKIFASV